MHISVVTTLYRSATELEEFYRRMKAAVEAETSDYELIFVNDGSPDDSVEIARRLAAADDRVLVVDLSRNFGHHKAMMTGLEYARGERVFLIDSDLEESPELLASFTQRLDEEEADVVYGVRKKRTDRGLFNRVAAYLFYGLFNFLSTLPITPNLLTVRLMTRRYVDSLLLHRDQVIIISGLWAATGYRQVTVDVETSYKGRTSYSFSRRLGFLVQAIAASSNKPLVYIAYLGLSIVVPASLYISYLLTRWMLFGVGVDGWTSVIVSLWFLGGLIIVILGVIAIYLSVIFTETKPRPYTIVRQTFGRGLQSLEK